MERSLTAAEMNHCLKVANSIGREINDEVNETFSNAIDGTVVKIMVAELILLNIKNGFIEINNKHGADSFAEVHSKIKAVIDRAMNNKGTDNGNRGTTGH